MTDEARILTERHDHVFRITLNRADKLNAFDARMLKELGEAYTEYENDDSLWCAVVDANGKAFTAGLELSEVGQIVEVFANAAFSAEERHLRRLGKVLEIERTFIGNPKE